MINLHKILFTNYLEREWVLRGNDYDGLEWLDESPKPSKQELESQWEKVEATIASKEQTQIQAKESAIQKLSTLGLTAEEIKALII
jgi:hypothetical protein